MAEAHPAAGDRALGAMGAMGAMAQATGLWSEVGTLRACLTCAPGDEFDVMVPAHIERTRRGPNGALEPNPDYLLFDDLVLLPLLQAEHALMVDVIRAVTGPKRSHDLRTMLQHVLADPAVAGQVIDETLELERQLGTAQRTTRQHARDLDETRRRLRDLGPSDLAPALLSGLHPHDEAVPLLRWPMPNWMFARDNWAMVGDGVVVGYPKATARKRDGILSRALLWHHPLLRDVPRLDLRPLEHGVSANEIDDDRCVEGGDVLVVSRGLVLIGIGVRTTAAAAQDLAVQLLAAGIGRVLGVYLPLERATMHLDTVFTFIDRAACLVHSPAFEPGQHPDEAVRVVDLAEPDRDLGSDLPGILRDLGIDLQVLPCGDGDDRAAAREQWTDGANAFCLGPGRILLYARNTRTLRALNRAGFEILTPAQFVPNADLLMTGDRRLVVALTGAELSRGRGGPRCLTLPLARGD